MIITNEISIVAGGKTVVFQKTRLAMGLFFLMLAGVTASSAQDIQRRPAIVQFTSDTPTIQIGAVENNDAQINLSWNVINMRENHHLLLDYYDGDRFRQIPETNNALLPAVGTIPVSVQAPSGFSNPTFRLSILNRNDEAIDREYLTLSYAPIAPELVSISEFTADRDRVSVREMQREDFIVGVHYVVLNRPPTANLMFEQVFPNGESRVIELPREVEWVPSAGDGTVRPVPPGQGDSVQLRLRVVDVIDGTVYAEQMLPLALDAADAEPEPTTARDQFHINAFSASPSPAAIGENVTFNWDVSGGGTVQIALRLPNQPAPIILSDNLPPNGSAGITLTPEQFGGLQTANFLLTVRNSTNEIVGIATQVVEIR
jgi:hypothetical protein